MQKQTVLDRQQRKITDFTSGEAHDEYPEPQPAPFACPIELGEDGEEPKIRVKDVLLH